MGDNAHAPRAAYFDTNLVREGGWPEPTARLLETLAKAQRAGVVPCLVGLVRDELIEGLIRDLRSERNALVKDGQKFARRTLGILKIATPAPLPPDAELRAHITKETEKLLGGFRAVTTTQQPTAFFSKLAISRGGAFVEGGKGFNDTVILVSVIEDMDREGIASAVLLSEDKGYQNEGMRQVVGEIQLRVITSLDAFDKLLDQLLTAKVLDHIAQRKQRLFAAVESHREPLVEFLRKNLSLTGQDVGTTDKLRQIELLEVGKLIDVHSAPLILGQENREENTFSVDVALRFQVETVGFVFERLDASEPRDFLPLPTDFRVTEREHDVVVTVEGLAEVGEDGIGALKFLRVYAKKDRGFASLLAGLT